MCWAVASGKRIRCDRAEQQYAQKSPCEYEHGRGRGHKSILPIGIVCDVAEFFVM
jgi:hypothetical protein